MSTNEEARFDWRGGWAAAVAFIATMVLLGMGVMGLALRARRPVC